MRQNRRVEGLASALHYATLTFATICASDAAEELLHSLVQESLIVRFPVECPRCGARYSIKTSHAGKKFKCKCGSVLLATSDSTPVETGTKAASPEVPASHPGEGSFLHALSDAQASAQTAEPMSVVPKASREACRFSLTTAMGPYAGRLAFIGFTLIVLLLANGLLLAFSISPITAAMMWSPLAIFAVFYAAMAVDSNKMMVEIDDQQLAIRFLKRLPWPVRDERYPLELIRRAYVEHRRVRKPFFSSAHSNDTETSRFGKLRVEYVFVYCVMVQISGNRWPTCIAKLEDQAIAISIVDFMVSKTMRG